MADDVQITAGSGTTIVTDDIGSGRQVQLVKPAFGGDGVATMVSGVNPLPVTEDSGTLVQRAEELVLLLRALLAGAGGQMPDTAGRMRVTVDAINATTLSAVTTVTTLSTVTKMSQIGSAGTDASLMVVAQSNLAAFALRDRINVT